MHAYTSSNIRRRMLHRALMLSATAAIVVSLGVMSEALELKTTQQTVTGILATGIDPLITDVAVTDDQLLTSGVTLDAIPTVLDAPNLLIVDDDRMQCPNANFQTITSAVVAAAPGATIRVCPGVYNESVVVDKPGLVLQAPRQQGQATQCKTALTDDPTKHAILMYGVALNGGNPSIGFDVQAPNVTIEGFTIEPDPVHVTTNGVGIFTSRFFTGYDIRHNVVQNNTFGIYLNSNGSAPTYVRENCARNNNLTGAAGGNGVYSDQGLSNAEITNNYFTGHRNAAIVIDTFLTTPHDIAITHNESVNDAAIAIFNSANLTVEYNKVINPVRSGIFAFGVTNSSYAFNHVENGTTNGVSLHEISDSIVKSNKAVGFIGDGIQIGDASTNNTIATNRAVNNGMAGLRVTQQSTGNTIQENHMKGNAPDCYDDTGGPGSGGTGNLWINDFGFTENRPDLCKHATVTP